MILNYMETAVCRTPAFSPGDTLVQCWPALKEMIREASPEFHRVIETLEPAQLPLAGEKINFSLWKYFNRARFRATPFAGFATVSYITVGSGPLLLENKLTRHVFTDWSEKDLPAQRPAPEWFQANATCYSVGEDIRYIRFLGTQFELATVPALPEISALLYLCRLKADRGTIYRKMAEQFGMERHSTAGLIGQLLSNQLLFSERTPNITGPDFFDRLAVGQRKTPYIITERKATGGGLDPAILRLMPEYFQFIAGFLPPVATDNLVTFQQRFSRKFDRRAVPLGQALDPETGVGYGELATAPADPELAALFAALPAKTQDGPLFRYTPVHRFLVNALLTGRTIQLEDYKNVVQKAMPLPNTFSAVFAEHCGKPVLESAGGCTANALGGRFTITGGKAQETGAAISAIEESANPEVLFFDVAYQAEKSVDNVNRRQHLYKSELALLSWSCHSDPIRLSELLVMVRNGEVVLWSKKHDCRVVPRIASAYNYTRSDLAVYRFLCDLQHQGLSTDLTFRFRQFLPGLDSYPRVCYKQLIVSPAMWKAGLPEMTLPALRKWLSEKSITQHFKCGHGDQTLCIDPANEEDLRAFLTYLRQHQGKENYISEALLGGQVADTGGNARIAQYIVNFFHREPVYRRCQPPVDLAPKPVFQPGSEWLYFELYCHPARSGQLLQLLGKFTREHKRLLNKWFFIRYDEPQAHLRFRLQLKSPQDAGRLMCALQTTLAGLSAAGLVSDVQIKTYSPEYERYGGQGLAAVEEFFWLDSLYTLRLLAHRYSVHELHLQTLLLARLLVDTVALPDSCAFVAAINAGFSEEFPIGKEGYKQLNSSFERIKKELAFSLFAPGPAYLAAYKKLVEGCPEQERLVADLIHMHINRTFDSDQRRHEAIIYQYLLKLLKTHRYHPAAVAEH